MAPAKVYYTASNHYIHRMSLFSASGVYADRVGVLSETSA
jgi:hypothetical protein